jgi:hypothetical protein
MRKGAGVLLGIAGGACLVGLVLFAATREIQGKRVSVFAREYDAEPEEWEGKTVVLKVDVQLRLSELEPLVIVRDGTDMVICDFLWEHLPKLEVGDYEIVVRGQVQAAHKRMGHPNRLPGKAIAFLIQAELIEKKKHR